jgi:hypothetical protein
MSSKTRIEISKELFDKIQSNLVGLGFTSVDECVEDIMNEFLRETTDIPKPLENDEEIIKARLKSLGYLK